MSNFIAPELKEYKATCRTKDCDNVDITLNVMADANSPMIICGVCGEQIEDVTAPK